MNCPTCGKPAIKANNGADWFCRFCWLPLDEAAQTDNQPRTARKAPQTASGAAERAICSITLELPLPPTDCSPNRESHASWEYRAQAREEYRAECGRLLPRVCAPMFQQATISAEFWHGAAPGRYHARDAQNAIGGIKALVDSLVELGYLPDDSAKFLTWGETTIHGAKESAGRAAVVVTLRRIETKL